MRLAPDGSGQASDLTVDMQVLFWAAPTLVSVDPSFLQAPRKSLALLMREHAGSDARFVCRYGIPVVMSRPFVGDPQTEHEWIDIASRENPLPIYDLYLK
ncbi:MAG TPA: hypothetical protein VNO43_18005 [Candidatus Eisenbacteria bacterium]|nr:hypothetical protein [Candidatus Eisenbacteria bacterium]